MREHAERTFKILHLVLDLLVNEVVKAKNLKENSENKYLRDVFFILKLLFYLLCFLYTNYIL